MNIFYILTIFLLFHLAFPQNCGLNPPEDESDCFNRIISEGSSCCLIWTNTQKLCNLIPKSQITANITEVYINNTYYNLKCNVNTIDGEVGTKCGSLNPVKVNDCFDNSTDTNNCCFYSYEDTKMCFWLGTNFSNQVVTYNNSIIDCDSVYITYHWLVIVVFIFNIIIIL